MSALLQFPTIAADIAAQLQPVRDMGITIAFQPNYPREWGKGAGKGIARIVLSGSVPLFQTGVGRPGGRDRLNLLIAFALSEKFMNSTHDLLAQTQVLLQNWQPNEWCGPITLGELTQRQPIGDYWIWEQELSVNCYASFTPTYEDTSALPLLTETQYIEDIF